MTVPITALEFSRDGSAIAASGYHEITFWKTADGTLDRRLTGLAERIYDIAYSPDGKWMATASGDPGVFGVAKLWLAEPGGGGKPVRDLVETQDVVFAVAFSPDSKKIATAGADRTIRIFEVETGKLLTQIEDHADWIFDDRLHPRRQAAGQRQPRQDLQGLRRREERVARHLPRPRPAGLHRLVHARRQGRRHRRRGQPDPDLEPRQRRQVDPRDRRLRRHGLQAAVLARRQDPARGQRRQDGPRLRRQGSRSCASLQGHNDWIYALAISPDSKTVASGSWDGEVKLWNLADGKLLRTIIAAPGYKAAGAQTGGEVTARGSELYDRNNSHRPLSDRFASLDERERAHRHRLDHGTRRLVDPQAVIDRGQQVLGVTGRSAG